MRFQDIKLLDNYDLLHLVTVEPTIVLDTWTGSSPWTSEALDGYVTRVWKDGVELVAGTHWHFEEATKKLIMTSSPLLGTLVAAVRFHFASKPVVLPRYLEESPMTADAGTKTEVDPRRFSLGSGAFMVTSTAVETSAYLGRDVTVKETYLDDLGGKFYYVIDENEGTRWMDGYDAMNAFLSTGDTTDTYYVGWPTQFTPLVSSVSGVSQSIDSENRHVPFESSGSVTLLNDQTVLGTILTKYAWHHAQVKVYWYSGESEAIDPELLYQGRATDLGYANDKITITFSTDIVTTSAEFKSMAAGLEHTQELFGDNPDAVVTSDVALQIARIPYGRCADYRLQSVAMDTPEGETVGGNFSFSYGRYVNVPNYKALSSIYPGDSLYVRSTGDVYTVQDHGRVDYGITGSATYSFSAAGSYLDITCTTANFSSIGIGMVVLLTPNGSFNRGAGQVISVPSSTTVRISLDGVPGYATGVTVNMPADTLTFWIVGQTYIRVAEAGTISLTSSDVGVIHRTPKQYGNRRFLVSPTPSFNASQYVSYIVGDKLQVTNISKLSVGDWVVSSTGVYKTIDSIHEDFALITFSQGISGFSIGTEFTRAIVQSAKFITSTGIPIQMNPATDVIVADSNERTYMTILTGPKELVTVFNPMAVEVRRRFIIDDTLNGDDSYPGKLKNVQVGDTIVVNTIPVVVCERINDYAVLAYPEKNSVVAAIYESAWNAMSNFYTATSHSRYKPFDNNTQVFVDCYGATDLNGQFVDTPAKMLSHTLQNVTSFDSEVLVDSATIEALDPEMPLLSYSVPTTFASTIPTSYKDVINDMCRMTHSVVHSEVASGVSRLTARGLFDTPEVKTLTDVDVFDVPETEVDFKGGPATLRAKFRIGDVGAIETLTADNERVRLGNKDLAEHNVWLYDSVATDRWIEKELLVNSGPRSIVKFECSANHAPIYGDRVRCSFRNNMKTARPGDPTSNYIQGMLLSRRHGADGLVYCEVDNLSGLSDKLVEAEFISYLVNSNLSHTSIVEDDNGALIDYKDATVVAAKSHISVAKMRDNLYVVCYINVVGRATAVTVKRIGGRFVFGNHLMFGPVGLSGGYCATYLSVVKLNDLRAVVAYRNAVSGYPEAVVLNISGGEVDSCSVGVQLTNSAAYYVNCVQTSESSIVVAWSSTTTASTAIARAVTASVIDSTISPFGSFYDVGYGINLSCQKLRTGLLALSSYTASKLNVATFELALDGSISTAKSGYLAITGVANWINIRRYDDYTTVIFYVEDTTAKVCYCYDDLFGGLDMGAVTTVQASCSAAFLIPYDLGTGRYIAVTAGSGSTRVRWVTWNGDTFAIGSPVFFIGYAVTDIAGVRV